jgi:ectoine hydroxylase-related dioxygenase (phytanoyl-CoA dioxygenase family)
MLIDTQKHHFETLGFIFLKNFFPPDEIQTYINAFDGTFRKAAGQRLKEPYTNIKKTIAVMRFFEYNPAVYHHLLESDAVCEVVEDLLGEDFVFSTSEGAYRFGNTGWHHDDVSPEGHIHLKVVLYLDPVRANTGCLSVLPGSHFLPYRQRMERYIGDILPLGKDVPGTYPIASNPGDVVIFNVKLYHAAFGEGVGRRAIYINYLQKPSTTEEKEHIKWLYHKDGGYYTPELFEDATPKRMRMLAFLKDTCYDAAF